jgi:hypothetical protein
MKSETLEPRMIEAIQAVLVQGIAIREAARNHNVPRTTLQRKIQRVEAAGGLAKVVGEQNLQSTTAEIMRMASSPPPQAGVTKTDQLSTAHAIASPQRAAPFRAPQPVTPAPVAMPSGSIPSGTLSPNKNHGTRSSSVSSTTSSDEFKPAAEAATSVLSRKRSADEMAGAKTEIIQESTPAALTIAQVSLPTVELNRTKGPRKAINGKIRMLCHSAGSALDELSNDLILEGKCVYKLGLGQSPFPVPQCIVDELRYVEMYVCPAAHTPFSPLKRLGSDISPNLLVVQTLISEITSRSLA